MILNLHMKKKLIFLHKNLEPTFFYTIRDPTIKLISEAAQ